MSAAVIAETPVGFRTWARPGACHTSTNAVSAPHRALYARDFMNPSSVSRVIRPACGERLRARERAKSTPNSATSQLPKLPTSKVLGVGTWALIGSWELGVGSWELRSCGVDARARPSAWRAHQSVRSDRM